MTTVTETGATAPTVRRLSAVAPGRDELIDGLVLFALTMVGIVGFRPAYGGHGYLIAGAAGALLGLLLSHFGQRARLPLLFIVAASVLAFLLFGGVISDTGTVSLGTLRSIADAAVSGWQQLLTTVRPVGDTSGLLALPYLLGLFAGVAGHALARRTPAVLLPAAAPAVVVGLSILFGGVQPTAAALQGAGFAVVALGWAAVRQQRVTVRHATIGRQRPWQRIGLAAAVLAVAGVGAVVIGPHLPGARAHQRVVLSAVPPSDLSAYPSPLAAYRDYTQAVPSAVSVYGKELFSTTGLAPGSLVQLAAMDTYDGLAWGVANASASGSFSGFQRVGALIPGAGDAGGTAKTAAITIAPAYDQPWLPDLAGTTAIAFTGAGAQAAESALRFNVATTTGIIAGNVPAGLSYNVSYDAKPVLSTAQLTNTTPDGTPGSSVEIPSAVQEFAQTHANIATTPMGKVLALAAYLKQNGSYSDGGGNQSSVEAGHGADRLVTFLESKQIVGDDEQYAAAMALLANAVGVPARASLDATVGPGGVVDGKNVHADIQVDLTGYGWVTLSYTLFTGTQKPTLQQQQITPPQSVRVVPPRQNPAAPLTGANGSNTSSRAVPKPSASPAGFTLPAIVVTLLTDAGIPLLAILAILGALAGAKALRRRRRRAAGPPATRVDAAWRELLDLARDLGIPSSAPTATRREQAAAAEPLGLTSATQIAAATDAAAFGPTPPDNTAVTHLWTLVDHSRQAATTPLPRWRRLWVAINPASLLTAPPPLPTPRFFRLLPLHRRPTLSRP